MIDHDEMSKSPVANMLLDWLFEMIVTGEGLPEQKQKNELPEKGRKHAADADSACLIPHN